MSANIPKDDRLLSLSSQERVCGEIRRVGVLKTPSLDEGRDLVSTDPIVKTGRLNFELHAWMIDKNILP